VARRAILGTASLAVGLMLLAPVGRGVSVEVVVSDVDGSTPLHVYVPAAAAADGLGRSADPGPGVVVVHGFAGSARLMHSWSLALAHAGFTVVAPDLPGHGADPTPMQGPEGLAEAVDAALAHLAGLPGVDAGRIAVLGHSMGSGAVLGRGVERPEIIRAVVAVSPTDAVVDEGRPRDLLLLAGANEPRYVANAESLLVRAGGEGGAPGDGDARRLVVVPRVVHVSLLFSRTAQDA
jgi:pimeloyl-ACP methyl ester carboxylesterase